MGFFDYSLSIKDRIISDFGITLYMLVVSAIFAGILGLILGVIMVVTDKGRILENKAIYSLSLIHISEPTRLHKVSRMPSSA